MGMSQVRLVDSGGVLLQALTHRKSMVVVFLVRGVRLDCPCLVRRLCLKHKDISSVKLYSIHILILSVEGLIG